MGIVIDTNVFIRSEREGLQLPIDDPLEPCVISAITASELLVGVHRANSQARRTQRLAFVEAILKQFPVIPIDLDVSRIHAQLSADQLAAGQLTATHDLWIASTAMSLGYKVLTYDVADFERVPGIQLLNITEPAEN